MLHLLVDEQLYLLCVDAKLLEDEGRDVFRLLDDAFQQVYWLNDLLAIELRTVHGLLNGLLCFDCKLV